MGVTWVVAAAGIPKLQSTMIWLLIVILLRLFLFLMVVIHVMGFLNFNVILVFYFTELLIKFPLLISRTTGALLLVRVEIAVRIISCDSVVLILIPQVLQFLVWKADTTTSRVDVAGIWFFQKWNIWIFIIRVFGCGHQSIIGFALFFMRRNIQWWSGAADHASVLAQLIFIFIITKNIRQLLFL